VVQGQGKRIISANLYMFDRVFENLGGFWEAG
jgi:hypothetical protein